jgi:hypothetical protein
VEKVTGRIRKRGEKGIIAEEFNHEGHKGRHKGHEGRRKARKDAKAQRNAKEGL